MSHDEDLTKPHSQYKKNKGVIDKNADPKEFGDRIATHTQELSHATPNITQGLNTSLMRAQQFLQSKIPQPSTSLPLSGEHKPSRTAMAKFNHYYETLNDPLSVLSHVKNGTLRNEHIEALASVYPKLYDEMKKKVTEHMVPEKAAKLPGGTKIAIAKFMGQPMDASMLPQAIMANQAALTGPRLGSQANSQSGKTTLGGLKELKTGERAATESQNLGDDEGE